MMGEQIQAPSSPRDGENVSISQGLPKVNYLNLHHCVIFLTILHLDIYIVFSQSVKNIYIDMKRNSQTLLGIGGLLATTRVAREILP